MPKKKPKAKKLKHVKKCYKKVPVPDATGSSNADVDSLLRTDKEQCTNNCQVCCDLLQCRVV